MRADVLFSVAEADAAELQGRTVVVVDVLRATSSIVEALASGASAVYPTVSTEDAIKLASSLGRDDTLLCGERGSLMVEGFDLGNSPLEFTRETVEDKRLVMSTTNGTRAFRAAAQASRVMVASLLNVRATIEALREVDEVTVLCAGRADRFALEDAACAGLILNGVGAQREAGMEVNDAAVAAMRLAPDLVVEQDFLSRVAAGRELIELGFEADVEHCARVDLYDIVPEFREGAIKSVDGT